MWVRNKVGTKSEQGIIGNYSGKKSEFSSMFTVARAAMGCNVSWRSVTGVTGHESEIKACTLKTHNLTMKLF